MLKVYNVIWEVNSTISVREAKYGERHKGSNYATFEYEKGNIYVLEIYIAFFLCMNIADYKKVYKKLMDKMLRICYNYIIVS